MPHKGFHHTEESKKKMSDGHKGKPTWSKGNHLSEGTRKKLSEAHKGKHTSKETEWTKGHITWNKGKRPTNETRQRMSAVRKGIHLSEETRQKMSEAHKGVKGKNHHNYGIRRSEEFKKKVSEALKGKVPYTMTEETKRNMSVSHIRAMKDGKYSRRPSLLEMKFAEICTRHNLQYKYVGNWKFWIGRMNPDFIEISGKRICIEVLGDYYHNEEEFTERKKRLVEQGWTVIGIWEHELNKLPEEEIVRKVQSLEQI